MLTLPVMAGTCPTTVRFNLVDTAHGVDSSRSDAFRDESDMRGASAVPHQNTVFRQITKLIPCGVLDRLIATSGADARVRRLSTGDQLLAMIFAQLAGARSIRHLEAMLESHGARRYHSGLRRVHRSTLADANAKRPAEVFTGLFAAMVGGLQRGLRRSIGECVHLIDSTSIRLNWLSAEWSQFSAAVCGVKAHVIYDAAAERAVYLAVTPTRVNDITAAKEMPIEPGATYVFDLGYYDYAWWDYAWWARLHEAGCRIVTRLKTNTPLRVRETRPVAEGGPILSDRIGLLPERLAKSRRNPMHDAVREIKVKLTTGKVLRILSNDLDAPATEIAELYKRRWAIELFFRWIKQTLKIGHFFGTSENAVRIQIAVALITFLLIKLSHARQSAVESLTTFARLLAANLRHRTPLDALWRTGPAVDPAPTQNNPKWRYSGNESATGQSWACPGHP